MKKFPIFLFFIGSSFASIGAMQQPSEVQTNLPQPQSQLVVDYDQLLLNPENTSYLSMLPADVRKLIQIPMHGVLFVQAAQKGDLEIVRKLLEERIPIDLLIMEDKVMLKSLLLQAVQKEDLIIIRKLLEAGVSVNLLTGNGIFETIESITNKAVLKLLYDFTSDSSDDRCLISVKLLPFKMEKIYRKFETFNQQEMLNSLSGRAISQQQYFDLDTARQVQYPDPE